MNLNKIKNSLKETKVNKWSHNRNNNRNLKTKNNNIINNNIKETNNLNKVRSLSNKIRKDKVNIITKTKEETKTIRTISRKIITLIIIIIERTLTKRITTEVDLKEVDNEYLNIMCTLNKNIEDIFIYINDFQWIF